MGMTNDQFDALAQLLRLRPGPAREGARLYFVDGVTQLAAAECVGASHQSVNNCVMTCRRGIELAKKAVGA